MCFGDSLMKRIIILLTFLYAPYIYPVFRIVQDSTLEALQLYEVEDSVSDDTEQSVSDQEAAKESVEENFNDQAPKFEQDPEQDFVDKKDVQERIAIHEILEYTLDDILMRAREYPGYYGDSDEGEITAWYEEAQNNIGYQKEILDRIKDDAKKHSLENILDHAQKHLLYKGLISYQKIVDTYYEIHPQKIIVAQKAFDKAIKFLHIDDQDNNEMYEHDMKKFLMEYRKLPTSLQQTINIETFHGVPYVCGQRIKNAKSLADFIIAHASEYQDCKDVIALLKS